MPSRPPRACRHPGCPQVTRDRDGLCAQHERRAFATPYGPKLPEPTRQAVLRRDGGRCVDCGHPAAQVDHIQPRAWGGSDQPGNLASVCLPCHRRRTAHQLAAQRRA